MNSIGNYSKVDTLVSPCFLTINKEVILKRLLYLLLVSAASVVVFSSVSVAFDPNNPNDGIAVIDRLLDSFDNLVNGNMDDLGPMMSFDVVEGDWATDFGDMSLWRKGNRVRDDMLSREASLPVR